MNPSSFAISEKFDPSLTNTGTNNRLISRLFRPHPIGFQLVAISVCASDKLLVQHIADHEGNFSF